MTISTVTQSNIFSKIATFRTSSTMPHSQNSISNWPFLAFFRIGKSHKDNQNKNILVSQTRKFLTYDTLTRLKITVGQQTMSNKNLEMSSKVSLLPDILSRWSTIYPRTFFHEEFTFIQYNLHQTFFSYIAFTYTKKLHGFKSKTNKWSTFFQFFSKRFL